jgi:hypothetical protein
MKQILLLFFALPFLFTSYQLNGQDCEPDPFYADSSAGIYPAPITDENPNGGIDEPACIGSYYEYTLTIIIPDSITVDLFGTELSLEIVSADVPAEGAIQGLPPGIDYLCSPSDCVMQALTSGCLLLFGTVPEGTSPGKYDLSLELNITFEGLGRQTFAFPSTTFPGEYFLTVRKADHPDCMTTSLSQPSYQRPLIYPNPVGVGEKWIRKGGKNWNYAYIYNMQGEIIQILQKNISEVNQTHLRAGIYSVLFDLGDGFHREKLIVY